MFCGGEAALGAPREEGGHCPRAVWQKTVRPNYGALSAPYLIAE